MSLSGRLPLRLLSLLTLLALAQGAPGEEHREDRTWYRVELILFANRDPDAALAETWPALPELAYPERWRGFEDGGATVAADRDFSLKRVEDTVPDLYELYWERSIESLLHEYEQRQLLRQPNIALEPLFDMTVPRPFVLLPGAARELNSQRRRINNSAGLDVLFHESWLQRIESREEGVPLIIEAGPRFGDYPELQGSILIYSGRYLHIATNLWLNTAGGYLDIDGGDWRMPPPPLPPDQSRPAFRPFRVAPSPDWLGVEPQPDLSREEETALFEEEPAEDTGTLQGTAILATAVPQPPGPGEHLPASEEDMQAFFEQPIRDYDFRHAILVNQQRRMRSGELHYIDHPMLGIVIRISRYEFEPFVTPEDPGLAAAR